MKCPECKLHNPDNAKNCDCGHQFTIRESEVALAEQARAKKSVTSKTSPATAKGSYFEFTQMVSTSIVRIAYMLGALALTIGGMYMMLSHAGGPFGVLIGLLSVTIGNMA